MATYGKGYSINSTDNYTGSASGTILTVPSDGFAIIGLSNLSNSSGDSALYIDGVIFHQKTGSGSSAQLNAGGIHVGGGSVISFNATVSASYAVGITTFKNS